MKESAAAFLETVRAADLVTMTEDGLVATFLPLLFDPTLGEHGSLLGHIARKNDQWRRQPIGEALVIAHWRRRVYHPELVPAEGRTRGGRPYLELHDGSCFRPAGDPR